MARTLLQKAIETDKDLSGRYVLLKVSRDIATQALDEHKTAFQAIGEMAKIFAINVMEMKIAVLKKLSVAVHTAMQHGALAGKAMELADVATSKEKFPAARQLNELALQEARNAKEPQLLARATRQTTRISNILDLFDAAQTAEDVLKNTPGDPAANLAAGRSRCFIKADWERGLAMLAKGSDAALHAAASKNLRGAESAVDQNALGDVWWELADSEADILKQQCQRRAAYWYEKAQPELSWFDEGESGKASGSGFNN